MGNVTIDFKSHDGGCEMGNCETGSKGGRVEEVTDRGQKISNKYDFFT